MPGNFATRSLSLLGTDAASLFDESLEASRSLLEALSLLSACDVAASPVTVMDSDIFDDGADDDRRNLQTGSQVRCPGHEAVGRPHEHGQADG